MTIVNATRKNLKEIRMRELLTVLFVRDILYAKNSNTIRYRLYFE